MPHRFIEHPLSCLFASLGVLTSFLASLSKTASETAQGTQTLFAAVDDSTLLSWAGTGVAVLAMVSPAIVKFIKGVRQANFEQDTAETSTWSGIIRNESSLRGVAEGQLKVALEQLESLKLQFRDVSAENRKLAAEVSETRHKTRNLEQELVLHKAASVKTRQIAVAVRDKTAEQDERLAAVEQVTGSTSAMDFPAPKPAEPKPE